MPAAANSATNKQHGRESTILEKGSSNLSCPKHAGAGKCAGHCRLYVAADAVLADADVIIFGPTPANPEVYDVQLFEVDAHVTLKHHPDNQDNPEMHMSPHQTCQRNCTELFCENQAMADSSVCLQQP